MIQLLPNWRDVLRRAWSIRLILLAGFLSGLEVVLPYFAESIPDGLFALASFLVGNAAFVSRLVAQKP